MTEPDCCPDISVLSAFLDAELTDEEKARFEGHLDNCATCAQQVKNLETANQLMMENLGQPGRLGDHSRSVDCLSGEGLTAYFHGLMSAEETSAAESHLDRCDVCLSELSAMARTDSQFRHIPSEPVPGYLREKVESFWKKEQKTTDQIFRIVCQLAQNGIDFLRDSLLPHGLTFQEVFATSGAYRSAGGRFMPSSILIKGELPGLHLGLSVDWERRDRAGLKLQLEDEHSKPLQSQRVLLRREQVLIHSERTDADGRLAYPNLDPGVYQLGIFISGKEFSIDIEIRSN